MGSETNHTTKVYVLLYLILRNPGGFLDFPITHQTKEKPTDQHKDLHYPIRSISTPPIRAVEHEH